MNKQRKIAFIILLSVIISSFSFIDISSSSIRPGEVLGDVLHTDIRIFIDNVEIAGYNINGYTYVIAEDLRPYGFSVVWNSSARTLSVTQGRATGNVKSVPLNADRVGSVAFPYVYTDIRTYINGQEVKSYNIRGQTVVQIDDVADAYGSRSWNSANRELRITTHRSAYIPVTNISGLPETATVGTPLTLTGTVSPYNATNRTIMWSIINAGTTGASISGNVLRTTAAGTVIVRATITNGVSANSNYNQNFNITVGAITVDTIITWNPNDGSSSSTTSTLTAGSNFGALPVPARPGFTFAGWFTTSNAAGGTQILSSSTVPNSNTTYWARWSSSTVTITWHANGGTLSPNTSSLTAGSNFGTLPTPTRTGHTFAGWFTTSNAAGGTQILSSSIVPSNNATYWARWSTANVTVTLDRNGGTSGSTSFNATLNSAAIPAGTTMPGRTGYTFDGYWTAATGGSRVITSNGAFVANVSGYTGANGIWQRTSAVTLVARWIPIQTNVTLSRPNATTFGSASFVATYDSAVIPAGTTMPTRNGYNFDGYWTSSSGGSRVITASGAFVANVSGYTGANGIWQRTSATTLYARWTQVVTITWNPNDGSSSSTTSTLAAGSNFGTLPVPTRPGYTFAGWFNTSNAVGGTQVFNSSTVPNGNTTYWARWTQSTVTITWNPNGGTVSPASSNLTAGLNFGMLPEPTRTGYTFVGWFTEITGGTQIFGNVNTVPNNNTTYWARWEPLNVTITLDANGGIFNTHASAPIDPSPTLTLTLIVGSNFGVLPTPTQEEGLKFAGWFTEIDSGTQITSSSIVPTTDRTYWAKWIND